MAHEVKLEIFEGPIDLLLHLITRRRVDIYEVSLATITDDYLAAVAHRDRLDLDSATGFLVVAATLLELKSARLLPGVATDPERSELLEERDRLLARLVECATYREAGIWLWSRLERGERFYGREVSIEPRFAGLVPDVLARTTPEDVAAAAARALAPKPAPSLDVSHLAPITASVREAIMDVAEVLVQGRRVSFAGLCGSGRSRIDVIVRFLALLELSKAGAVELTQDGRFEDIFATWTGEVSVDQVLAEADEYAAPRGGDR